MNGWERQAAVRVLLLTARRPAEAALPRWPGPDFGAGAGEGPACVLLSSSLNMLQRIRKLRTVLSLTTDSEALHTLEVGSV